MNKLFLISGIIAASFTAFSSAAFAEGSNDLVNNTGNNGYRPYLEWRDRQNFGLQRKSVIYVYAEEGETIYFGSSVWRSSEKALKSVLSDNPEKITDEIGHDMTGATVAITLPAEEGGMPYDPTDAEVEIDDGVIGNFKWRSVLANGNITAGNTGIYLTRPDGTYKGYIKDTSQEEIGPHIDESTTGGYEPMSFTAPVTGTYAFRFLSSDYGEGDPEHIKVDETWLTGKLPDGTDNYLETTKENDATVAAWDITVVDNGEKQEGRVWTDTLFLNTGAHETPVKSEMYTLTYDGFEYRVNLNGMEPFGFALYSNNRGPLIDMYNMAQPDGSRPWGENGEVPQSFDNLRSLTHSFYSFTKENDVGPGPTRTEKDGNGNELFDSKGKPVKSTIINNFDPVDPKRDHTHKLFFNQPSTEAVSAYTRQKKLVEKIDDIVPPKKEPKVTYDGYGYAAGSEGDTSYGTWGIGGAFKINLGDDANFESNTTDTYRIVLDFSKYALDENNKPIIRNGLWARRAELTGDTEQRENEKNNIVILVKVLEKNQEEILWDGQDAYGNNVPVGIYEGVGNTSWETGAAHFPLVDVEYNPKGIIIERMNTITDDNADTEEARYTVYYNNEANGNDNTAWYYAGVTDGNYPTIGDGLNMLAGTSSKNGAMKYEGDRTKEGNGNGNYTVLDIWSRYIAPSTSGITIGVKRLPSQSSAMVSFVAAEGKTGVPGTFDESHVKQNGETLWETENRGDTEEKDIYGNTISTGFTATVTKVEIDNSGYDYITWDITIPMEGETYTYYDTSSGQAKPVTATAEPSYIKIPSENGGVNAQNEEIIMSIAEMFGEESLDQEVSTGSDGEIEDLGSDPSYAEEEFDSGLTAVSLTDAEGNEQTYNNRVWDIELKLDGTPVLKDGNSKVNKGDIYEITGIEAVGTQEYKKLKLQLAYKLPKVSGEATVTYGIIIDNLYAPSAVAEINYSQEKPSAEYDDLDTNENAVQAGSLNDYDSNSDYNQSDYNY